MGYIKNTVLLLLSFIVVDGFIIPNELPTILSLVYSNIPPLKIGQDTRFGIGFRLGPHADFQTILELGPQTNTGPLAQDSPSKRESSEFEAEQTTKPPIARNEEQAKPEKIVKKSTSNVRPKVAFKKIPGIDYR